MTSAAELVAAGYIGTTDGLVQIRETVGDPHSGPGGRAYACTLAGGLAFEVLPERGLDIGAVWYGGRPVAWRSPLGSPGPSAAAREWIDRFGGGLVITCGLDNIGPARAGLGQHGTHHDTRAYDVVVARVTRDDGTPGIRITGTVDSMAVFGRRVRVHRTITAWCDDPALHLTDTIVNDGAWPAPVAVLYHCNFGAPLVLPGTRVGVRAESCNRREPGSVPDDPTTYPGVIDHVDEAVWVYTGLEATDGWAAARVTSPEGLVGEVRWRTDTLPYLFQWVFPTRSAWALGLEPANAPMWGPERDCEGAGVPVLAPGATLVTEVEVRFSAPQG